MASSSHPRRGRRPTTSSTALSADVRGENHMLQFEDPAHVARFERIRARKFQESRYIDWDVLREVRLADGVQALVGQLGWDRFFSIQEVAYREATLEFLSTFRLESEYYAVTGPEQRYAITATITFRSSGQMYTLSLREFTGFLGLYDAAFLDSPDYHSLRYDLPHDSSAEHVWQTLAAGPPYEAKSSKASFLISPAVHYVHHLLSRSLSGRGESSGVVTRSDILYLYSMTAHYHIHLGYFMAQAFRHSAEHTRVGTTCVGPYVTHLLRGMGILDTLPPMTIAARMVPITIATLRALRIVEPRPGAGPHVYRLVRRQDAQLEHSGDEIEEELPEEHDDHPQHAPSPHSSSQHTYHGEHSSSAHYDQSRYEDLFDSYAFFRIEVGQRFDRVEQTQEEILRNQRDLQHQFDEAQQWSQDALSQLCGHFDIAMPPPPHASRRRRRTPPPPPTDQ